MNLLPTLKQNEVNKQSNNSTTNDLSSLTLTTSFCSAHTKQEKRNEAAEDEDDIETLLKQIQSQKQREIRARAEKERIRRELENLPLVRGPFLKKNKLTF